MPTSGEMGWNVSYASYSILMCLWQALPISLGLFLVVSERNVGELEEANRGEHSEKNALSYFV